MVSGGFPMFHKPKGCPCTSCKKTKRLSPHPTQVEILMVSVLKHQNLLWNMGWTADLLGQNDASLPTESLLLKAPKSDCPKPTVKARKKRCSKRRIPCDLLWSQLSGFCWAREASFSVFVVFITNSWTAETVWTLNIQLSRQKLIISTCLQIAKTIQRCITSIPIEFLRNFHQIIWFSSALKITLGFHDFHPCYWTKSSKFKMHETPLSNHPKKLIHLQWSKLSNNCGGW